MGIQSALEHLSLLGHHSLAFLSGPTQSWMNRERWKELMTGAGSLGMSIVEISRKATTNKRARMRCPESAQPV